MKKSIITLALLAMSAMGLQAQNIASSDIPNGKCKIYFIRENGNMAFPYLNSLIDNKDVCNIRPKRYSSHIIDTGIHIFSVVYKIKENDMDKKYMAKFRTEENKVYYFKMSRNPNPYSFSNPFLLEEMGENSAKTMMNKLKEEICN